jgi:hypothetical protein
MSEIAMLRQQWAGFSFRAANHPRRNLVSQFPESRFWARFGSKTNERTVRVLALSS